MELPQVGNFCAICGSLDFVPFTCPHCEKQLCGDHASMPKHNCEKFTPEITADENSSMVPVVQCSFCSKKENFEIKCNECGFPFCVSHRHAESHSCKVLEFRNRLQNKSKTGTSLSSKSENKIESKIEKVPAKVPKSAKNEALAKKIAFMKLKQTARGDTKVAAEERMYFNVVLPNGQTEPFFFNRRLQIGRIIDILCLKFSLQLKNSDNQKLGILDSEKNSVIDPSSELSEHEHLNCCNLELKYFAVKV